MDHRHEYHAHPSFVPIQPRPLVSLLSPMLHIFSFSSLLPAPFPSVSFHNSFSLFGLLHSRMVIFRPVFLQNFHTSCQQLTTLENVGWIDLKKRDRKSVV